MRRYVALVGQGLRPAARTYPAPVGRRIRRLELSCRAAAEAATAIGGHANRLEEVGRGGGGDTTLAIDRAAENAVFAELEALDGGLTAISESVPSRI